MKNFIKEENITYLTHDGYDKITGKLEDGSATLLELLKKKVEKFPEQEVMGAINTSLQIEYLTFKEIDLCAKKLGLFLSKITQPGEIVGIASVNRPEWIMSEYATYYSNCINAPFYTTFKEQALSFIISTTKMRVLIGATGFVKMIIEKVLDFIPADLIQLEHIILMDKEKEIEELCTRKGLKVTSISDILFGDKLNTDGFYSSSEHTICAKVSRYFRENPNDSIFSIDKSRGLPKSNDIATLSFTSGTTGVPKGVKLTHLNFISQIEAFEMGIKQYDVPIITPETIYFSCLPLAHVFERIVFCVSIASCARICFFRGDKTKIGEDIKTIQPSFIAVVPKILQSFHQKIEEKVSAKRFYERFVYKFSLNLKIFLQRFNIRKIGILDRLVFKQVSDAFGGKITQVLCGGAGIDPDLIRYLTAVLNVDIFQGYGQTEGLGANLLCVRGMNDPASVGIPFPTTRFKLVDVDNTLGKPSSEKVMYMKGYSITQGYYQPPEEIIKRLLDTGKFPFKTSNINESPFDEDGWLCTGDVVVFRNGKLYIVGRSKDLVKLDNGEYISPESIENGIRETDLIKDVFVTKIPSEDKFVALVSVPEKNVEPLRIASYLKSSVDSLIASKVIPKCVQITKFAIVNQCFTDIENGVLYTPTLKKKRFIFCQKFENELKNALSIEKTLEGNLSEIRKND